MNTEKLNKRVIAIVAAAVVILFSGHALQTILPYTVYMIMTAAAVTLPFTAYDITHKKLNPVRSALLALTAMVVLTLAKELGQYFLTYAFMLSVIFVAFRVTQAYAFEDIMTIFLKLMTLVTVISLVGYTLVNTTNALDFLPVYENVNHAEYAVGIIFNYIVLVPERNCGMFWEPGMFATFLSFALIMEIAFNKGKLHIPRIVIYCLGIITANSAAGFVLLMLAAVLILARNKNDKVLYYIGSGLVLLILVFTPIILSRMDNIINNSFLSDNQYVQKLLSENLVEQTRTKAFSVNLELFLKNPLLGAGIIPTVEQVKYVSDTSTSTFLLAAFGILGALYTYFILRGIIRQKHLNILTKIIVSAMFLIIVNKEPHQQIVFTWCLIFYMLGSDKLSIIESEEVKDEVASEAEKHQA